MTTPDGGLLASRLDLAGARGLDAPGAGPARRAAATALTRDWLARRWEEALDGRGSDGLALAAVGSLARGDGGPLSDLDLVLLHSGRVLDRDDLHALADRVWYPLWDAGLRLDHSVRTVAECRGIASKDLSAAVGLLDLKGVAGDAELVTAARATVAHDWRANARTRLQQLLDSLQARHHRHGDLAQSLEPDLKEAHGGLRDMAVLRALVAAWLADRPHGPVDDAYRTLLDARDAVHVATGRGRDRLSRHDQDAVAALLGHGDADELLTAVSTAGRTLAYALDGTVRRAGQSQRARTLRVRPRRPRLTPLGHGFHEHDGEVVLAGSATAATDPLLALRGAGLAARSGLVIASPTLANLAAHSPRLPVPWPAAARELFAELLASGPGLVPVWEGLDQAGIVERWLPEWGRVRSRPQRSPVHRHTVDRHLLETVVEAGRRVRTVSRPDLLVLAALLHDIGKVPGARDHSTEGAPVAAAVATRLGHTATEAEVVITLVREHLTLVDLATRRDHRDPRTVTAARRAVGGSRDTFDLLVALTEADASATGGPAWTPWRAALLQRLAERVRAGWDEPTHDDRCAEAGDLGGVAEAALAAVTAGEPHVVVTEEPGAWRVDVTDRDRLGLFADTAGLLAAEGLVVRSAAVRTVEGVAANQWHVESPRGEPPDAERLARGLARLATGDRTPLRLLERRRQDSRRASWGEPVPTPRTGPSALLLPHASADATVVEVRTHDRPGLLHDLGLALARAGLSVRSAHIATHAGQTLDTFYLTGFAGRPLPAPRVAEVVSLLVATCEGPPQET